MKEIINIIHSEDNNLINAIMGENIFIKMNTYYDTKKDYIDIVIDKTLDKETLKYIIDIIQEVYNQMN